MYFCKARPQSYYSSPPWRPGQGFILKHEFGATVSEGISSLVVERVVDIIMIAVLGALSFLVLNVPEGFIR